MSSKITIDELEKYLWGSAVLLRTHVDAGAYPLSPLPRNRSFRCLQKAHEVLRKNENHDHRCCSNYNRQKQSHWSEQKKNG